MRDAGWKVFGPYRERGPKNEERWRVKVRPRGGKDSNHTFATRGEAEEFAAGARDELREEGTVSAVLEDYELHRRHEKGDRQVSVDTTMARLKVYLPGGKRSVRTITAGKLQRRYDARSGTGSCIRKAAEVSVDTHRNELGELKCFTRWLVERGHLRKDPAAGITPMGKRHKGKPKYRPSEARRFLDKALELAAEGDEGALAVALPLVIGAGSLEIRCRFVRDVDTDGDGNVLLWIDDEGGNTVKREARRRSLEVPGALGEALLWRCEGRGPDARLFPAEAHGGYRSASWLRNQSRRVAELAGDLPYRCPHGLRGTQSSLASEAGATGRLVMATLGHSVESTHREHYSERGALARGQARRALKVLAGGR